jgi:hypothetical protein
MQLNISGIVAKCFSCGCKEFASLRPDAANRSDRLACVRCCAEVVYEDLISQIARTAVDRSSPKSSRAAFANRLRAFSVPLLAKNQARATFPE